MGRWTPLLPTVVLSLVVASVVPGLWAQENPEEWGDAPEGGIAYPSTGVIGQFPTCSPGALIKHGSIPPLWTYFGGTEDYETDGNAGACGGGFPPYDGDECFQDGDAGLIRPQPYTISQGVVVPCGSMGTPLQDSCSIARWGTDIDIMVHHSGYPTAPGCINVLFDWNQDGRWKGADTCTVGGVTTAVPEHVLVDIPLPTGYIGPLSGLLPPNAGFAVGPRRGYVWARFMVSELQVGNDWDGSGSFEGGESEDYLIEINPVAAGNPDFGDAPESRSAYPGMGVPGQFPTCINVGTSGWVQHAPGGQAWFGPMVDGETDGNAGNCAVSPPFPPYDQDECFQDADAGLIMPPSYTISGGNYVPCQPGVTGALGAPCSTAVWGRDIDILVTNTSAVDMVFNFLVDWNQDGLWGGQVQCPSGPVDEHVVVDFPIPAGFSGPMSSLGPAPFVVGPGTGFVWTRFTISPVPVGYGWDGSGIFDDGESEDYLLRVTASWAGAHGGYEPPQFHLYPGKPNPFTGETMIRFELPYPQRVRLAVYEASGRLVRVLFDGIKPAGSHEVSWDGADAASRAVGAGVYFCRMESGTSARTCCLVVIR